MDLVFAFHIFLPKTFGFQIYAKFMIHDIIGMVNYK